MAVNIPGIIAVIIFYILIIAIGIWAGRKGANSTTEELLVANRGMGLIVSFFTMTATLVGGAYINGTAEILASSGVVWAQAPVAYCLAFLIGGVIYGPKMRRAGYITMYDPFQIKFGNRVGALMCIPQFMGDLFWTAAILAALGSTIAIILDIDQTIAVIISACVAIFYTVLGGLWSVAYTDVVQLICIAIGLIIAVPFALNHESVDFSRISDSWQGTIPTNQIGYFIDIYGVLLLGGIPWQVYYQRILACKTPERARLASLVASVATFCFAIPAACMGVAGASADWNQTSYTGEIPIPKEKMSYILPLVLQYLCPLPVSLIGLGAVSAAVMSSADSSILSTSSVFAKNIYQQFFRPKASDREMVWVLRIGIIVAGALATSIAIGAKSVYGLYVLCSDLMYVILFPQFTCVLFFDVSNAYGSLIGYTISVILRVIGGEAVVKIPPLIHYPFYTEEAGQNFPFRTLAMLCSLISTVLFSWLFEIMFKKEIIPKRFDVFGCTIVNMPNLHIRDAS
ncbi:hypothetical protein LOTGIDRAFT_177946 [Lottia gigantea]|uniref:Uncharacterized protein n=1 Tax=Lottia gigantea TaxID=225164 RepID=V4CH56_LOTGI|nr:hypothetical protein LOTGIDRAFT_177946 [Lottia gigantea]ESP01430.1 hypothetical protein LOTGIDRAFT_177946 [Lottia gigantea]